MPFQLLQVADNFEILASWTKTRGGVLFTTLLFTNHKFLTCILWCRLVKGAVILQMPSCQTGAPFSNIDLL